MGGEHPAGSEGKTSPLEEAVALAAGRRLEALAAAAAPHVAAIAVQRHPEPGTDAADGHGPLRGSGIETVIQVRGVDLEPDPSRHPHHAPEQGGRVAAAGEGDQQALLRGDRQPPAEVPFQVLHQPTLTGRRSDGGGEGRGGQEERWWR